MKSYSLALMDLRGIDIRRPGSIPLLLRTVRCLSLCPESRMYTTCQASRMRGPRSQTRSTHDPHRGHRRRVGPPHRTEPGSLQRRKISSQLPPPPAQPSTGTCPRGRPRNHRLQVPASITRTHQAAPDKDTTLRRCNLPAERRSGAAHPPTPAISAPSLPPPAGPPSGLPARLSGRPAGAGRSSAPTSRPRGGTSSSPATPPPPPPLVPAGAAGARGRGRRCPGGGWRTRWATRP
jgi:hypothetical protein